MRKNNKLRKGEDDKPNFTSPALFLECWDDENEIGERVWMELKIESMEKVLWMVGVVSGDTNTTFKVYPGLVWWDDEDDIGEQEWVGPEIESVLCIKRRSRMHGDQCIC